ATLVTAIAIAAVVAARITHHARPAPYSLEDRRMTFAVLPFQAPAGDAHGERVAQASTDAVVADLETEQRLMAQSITGAQVHAVLRRSTGPRDIARALNVHFLVQGIVARASNGYTLSVSVLDGETERTLASESLPIEGDALTPRWAEDVDVAVFHLVMAGMHVEVQRAADRPPAELDVRDLSFRALDYWRAHRGKQAKDGYVSASDLLAEALKRAPDDALATYLTAEINLCDCVMAWSTNPEEQRRIGVAAMDRYLRVDPTDPEMLSDKASLLQLRGRYEEALDIANAILQRRPDLAAGVAIAAISLSHLGRASEAVGPVDALARRYPDKWEEITALAADVHYAAGDYAAAAQLARNAAARMSEIALRSPVTGPVRLTLAAAEARLGHAERARQALEDFAAAVPGVGSIGAVRHWIMATSPLSDSEPFYAGLRLAGLHD
ncbi:MAG: hypothetical protein JSR54_16870, partial [Proteobacteria bacterium]|nr:hypothetical protein [Pseudomonadota bacterium]